MNSNISQTDPSLNLTDIKPHPDCLTFEQVSDQGKVEVGAEVETYKMIHLLAVPLQRASDLHEHLLWTLQKVEDRLNHAVISES